MLPRLAVTPKDRFGNKVSLEDSIITYQGAELKVWQAVVKYAATQLAPNGANPSIPEYYAASAGRINQGQTIPLLLWPALAVLVIITLIILLLRRRRRGRVNPGITG